MDLAPRDGTIVRLLVDYRGQEAWTPLEDAEEAWTIGSNNFDNDGEDQWRFAGWNWHQDYWCEGFGKPIGWLPFFDFLPPPPAAPQAAGCAEVSRCFICDGVLHDGDMVLNDVSGDIGHRACFGEDREGFVRDVDTGEPLRPDDPLPTGYRWDDPGHPQPAVPEWGPISSAPKSTSRPGPGGGHLVEGVYLLGFCPEDGRDPKSCIDVIWWEPHADPNGGLGEGNGCWFGGDALPKRPTHWMALPVPPKGAASA